MSFLRKSFLLINQNNRYFSNQLIRQYSKNSRLEEIERLREGYANSRHFEENDLSKNVMERIKNMRSLAPSIHDPDFYSASKNDTNSNDNENDDNLYLPMDQTIKINGRGAPKRIKKSDVEIVSMKDY